MNGISPGLLIVVPIFNEGSRWLVLNPRGHMTWPPWEGLHQSTREESQSDRFRREELWVDPGPAGNIKCLQWPGMPKCVPEGDASGVCEEGGLDFST